MHLELTDEQTESADPGAIPDHRRRSLPPQSPYRGSEGYPWDHAAGARSPGTGAAATALRAAEQGTVCTATRLAP
jgi:hypothetical protein